MLNGAPRRKKSMVCVVSTIHTTTGPKPKIRIEKHPCSTSRSDSSRTSSAGALPSYATEEDQKEYLNIFKPNLQRRIICPRKKSAVPKAPLSNQTETPEDPLNTDSKRVEESTMRIIEPETRLEADVVEPRKKSVESAKRKGKCRAKKPYNRCKSPFPDVQETVQKTLQEIGTQLTNAFGSNMRSNTFTVPDPKFVHHENTKNSTVNCKETATSSQLIKADEGQLSRASVCSVLNKPYEVTKYKEPSNDRETRLSDPEILCVCTESGSIKEVDLSIASQTTCETLVITDGSNRSVSTRVYGSSARDNSDDKPRTSRPSLRDYSQVLRNIQAEVDSLHKQCAFSEHPYSSDEDTDGVNGQIRDLPSDANPVKNGRSHREGNPEEKLPTSDRVTGRHQSPPFTCSPPSTPSQPQSDKGTQIDSPDAEQYMYPLDRYLGAKPEEWRPVAPPSSPSNDSDLLERAQSLVREAETQLDSFRRIYNIESESDKQQPEVRQGAASSAEGSAQVSPPSRMHNIVVALDALQAESSRLEDDVLRARAFAKDISNELESDRKPSKSGRPCRRHPCERRTRKLVSERSRDPQDTASIPSPRKQAQHPRSEATSANTYDIEQRKLSSPSRRRSQRLTWHANLLRAKSSTEGTDDGYNTSDGRRYRESQSSAERRCKCAINKKKCLCLLYHRKVPEKPAVEGICLCRGRNCSCSSREVKSSQKWQLSRHQSNVNICPCCEQQKRDHVKTVVKKKYTPGCCKATLIDVKTKQWSTEEDEEVTRKKLPLAKLTVQELPSINIRRELKIQRVPSYDLPKPPGEEIPYTPRENIGLVDYTHDDRIRERQSRWRKGDDIRQIRQSTYIGENISDSEVHRARRVEKEVIVVHPTDHSSKPAPSKPCTHKPSRLSPCQCSLRSHKSVHFSGVEEHTFMFDLNHGKSFSLERRSSETEFSSIEASAVCEMMGLRDSSFARQPFEDTDYDGETDDICAHCRSLSRSSRPRAADTKPVSKFSSKERPREKEEPKDTRPVPKQKKQIPVPQERKQDLGRVPPCKKSDNLPCKSRKTLEKAKTADVSSTLQHGEERIQADAPLVKDRQEETALSCKPQQPSSLPQKTDQAIVEPQSPPTKNRVESRITQTSYCPQEGPSTCRQWEQSSGGETLSVPCKGRKNLVQARLTGMSFVPEERPSTLSQMERSIRGGQAGSPPCKHRTNLVQAVTNQTSYTPQEGPSASHQQDRSLRTDQAGAEPRSPPCKHRRNLVQAVTNQTSYTPQEGPSASHQQEQSLRTDQAGAKPRSPPCKHRRNLVQAVTNQTSYTPQEGLSASHQHEQSLRGDQAGAKPQSPPHKQAKNLAQKQDEPATTAVPKTKIARHERKSYPFPDSSYIPIAAMAPFPPPAKDKRTKHSELRKMIPKSEKAHERLRAAQMDQSSVFPDVSYIPMVIQSPRGIQSLYDTDYRDEAADDRASTSPRREVRSKRSPSDTPTITVYSSKDPPSKRQETRAAPSDRENKEEAKEMKVKLCACGRADGRCSCASQQEESNVKAEKSERHVNLDTEAKPDLNSVQKSKRGRLRGIFDPLLLEIPSKDLWNTTSYNESDAAVPVVSQSSTGFIPQDHRSVSTAAVGSSISGSEFLSAGSMMQRLFTSHQTEDVSSLCVSGIPFLVPGSPDRRNMRLSHTSHPPSENEMAQQPEELRKTSGEVNVDGPERSPDAPERSPDAPESPTRQTGSGDVTSSEVVRQLQEAIMSRVEHAIMKGLLNESETSDSPSEVIPSEQDAVPPEGEEAVVVEYEEDFESEEEGAEDEAGGEEVVVSEDAAEDSQEFSISTSQEAAVQTSFIKRSEPPQTFPEAAVQTSFIKPSKPPQTFPEAAVQTSFIKRSEPPQTFPEAAVQTSLIQLSSASAASPDVAAPASPTKSSPSTMRISPQPPDPTPPRSPSKKLTGATSQRPCSSCPVRKLSPALKKKSTDSTLVSSPKKSTVETPTEVSPPRTPVLSPKKASPSRSPVKTPPPSPDSGSFSPEASAKKTPLLSAESSSSDTEERVISISTPLVTPPNSPSPSLPDVETPSPTEKQQQNAESSQADEPVQPAPEPRQRRVEEFLIPIGSERTDVSSTILSDSVATDKTSETPVSVDQEETVLSEGEIRADPCRCKNCRRTCVCPGVSTGEVHQPCRCGRSAGEVQPQMDDSIGEVHHHKHTGHRHSHRSSTYSDGQVLPGRGPRRHEESYSVGEVVHTYSTGQLQSLSTERHIEVYLSSSLTGQSSDSEYDCSDLCGEVFDQEIHLPSVSNGSDEQSQTIHSLGQLSEEDSGS